MFLNAIQWGFGCALIGVAYAVVLKNDDTPLNFWFNFLGELEVMTPKLAKPLGACAVCFSGQLALWSSLIHEGFAWGNIPLAILSASVAILSATAITKFYLWTTN